MIEAVFDAAESVVRITASTTGAGLRVERSLTTSSTRTLVRGGFTATGQTLTLLDYEFPAAAVRYHVTTLSTNTTETVDVNVERASVELVVPAKPWLNMPIKVLAVGQVERGSRVTLHSIIGRTLPIAVTDVRGGRAFTLEVGTESVSEYDRLDQLLASGEPVYLAGPARAWLPAGYYVVDGAPAEQLAQPDPATVWALELIECAMPDARAVVGITITWAQVAAMVSWQTVAADHATWADLVAATGEPLEVVI